MARPTGVGHALATRIPIEGRDEWVAAGPWDTFQWHTNVGIVWLGPTTFTTDWRVDSRAWGPDCYLTSIPGYYGTFPWCGVYNPQVAWALMPGSNFNLYTYVGVHSESGWMRYYAYSNGGMSSAWGGWS
jgi:hypothetical protein